MTLCNSAIPTPNSEAITTANKITASVSLAEERTGLESQISQEKVRNSIVKAFGFTRVCGGTGFVENSAWFVLQLL